MGICFDKINVYTCHHVILTFDDNMLFYHLLRDQYTRMTNGKPDYYNHAFAARENQIWSSGIYT